MKARYLAIRPVFLVDKACQVNIDFYVHGGGKYGQADACRTALGKALKYMFPELETIIRNLYLDYDDGRRKERKKTNKLKARKDHTYVRR